MKALLVFEYRHGTLLDSWREIVAFAKQLGASSAGVAIGYEETLPCMEGTLFFADAALAGEYDPELHKRIVLEAAARSDPDYIVFPHSSWGWDLAPRVSVSLGIAHVSGICGLHEGSFETSYCNGKLRRRVLPADARGVLTVQEGAFAAEGVPQGVPRLQRLQVPAEGAKTRFCGYEAPAQERVELGAAEVVVGAGRGVGRKENVAVISSLARALGGEMGATRPVTDAGWLEQSRQIGITGQRVSPRLYVACGISGAIQHLAGIRRSEFVVAINKDKAAPISEIADVLVVADVVQFVPELTSRLQ